MTREHDVMQKATNESSILITIYASCPLVYILVFASTFALLSASSRDIDESHPKRMQVFISLPLEPRLITSLLDISPFV